MAATGIVDVCPPGGVFFQRGLERRVRQLVHSQRTHQRMRADLPERAPVRPTMIPACGPAEQFVAAEHDDVGTGGETV